MHKGVIPRCFPGKLSSQVLLVSGYETAFMKNRNSEAVSDRYPDKHSLKLRLTKPNFAGMSQPPDREYYNL
jgi:hypothetical protein